MAHVQYKFDKTLKRYYPVVHPRNQILRASGFIVRNEKDIDDLTNLVMKYAKDDNYHQCIERIAFILVNESKMAHISLNPAEKIWKELEPYDDIAKAETFIDYEDKWNFKENPLTLIEQYFSPYPEIRDKLLEIVEKYKDFDGNLNLNNFGKYCHSHFVHY